MKISAGTVARTIILALALLNQALSIMGYKVIPIEDEQINSFVTVGFTIVSSVISWWKNNSFSKKAIEADGYLESIRR